MWNVWADGAVRSATFVIGSRNSKKGCLSNIFQKHPLEYSGYFGKVAGKCEKCQNTLKESKKGIFCNSRQNLRHVLSFCIFAMQFAFCSFFRGSYLGTPAIQFETGSPSSNVIVKVPIDVIHVVNGSIGIDIFSCMSLQNVASDTATGCILQCLKQVHILSQQRTQTILLYYLHRIWVKSYHRVQHV
jgi:hypothetical protein